MQQFLLEMFAAAVESVSAAATVPRYLPPAASGRTIVIGAGKAAASMAQAVESHWSGSLSGRVVTRYGHAVPCESIAVVEAAHPVPDTAGQEAAEQILQTVSKLNQDDLVICLISGGGSSLLALPAPGGGSSQAASRWAPPLCSTRKSSSSGLASLWLPLGSCSTHDGPSHEGNGSASRDSRVFATVCP